MKRQNGTKKERTMAGAFGKLLPVMIKAAPFLFIASMVVAVLHGVSFGVVTMMQQRFFDRAVDAAGGRVGIGQAFLALALLGIANVACQVLNGVGNFLPDVVDGKVGAHLSMAIQRKIARLDPAVFEDTEKLDDINKAEQGKDAAFWYVSDIIAILTFYVPYFVFMGWYLFSLKPILVSAIVIIFLPTALAQLIRVKAFSRLEDASAPVRREYEYYETCMAGREYFKETRILGGFSYFKKLYQETLVCLQRLKFKATMKSNLFELSTRAVTVAGYCAILWMLYDALMKREVTVGAFAAVFNSIGMLYDIMEEVVCSHIGEMAANTGSIRNYLNFLAMEERAGQRREAPDWGDMVLENVSFAYPAGKKEDGTPEQIKYAVKNVSLTLHRGETLAVVGENGSGKSTLIRLIAGLYLPGEGTVRKNGVDTRQLTMDALTCRTSAVFQKFQCYQMTLAENIVISNPGAESGKARLDSVCAMAGTEPGAFPQGYDTMLSREFDGIDLSGGQWQRVAIARGFFRGHDLIILDEPTAAIDPYEETRIYNRFAEIARDKSAVIVTHRLGSVKLADRILVMKDGEAVQMGTHEELIAREGEYKRLYEAQEQWYKS